MNTICRRSFLRGAIAAPAVAGLAGVARSAAAGETPAPSGPPRLKLSILSYSFRGLLGEGKMDVFGYLETCKYRFGVDAADIWTGFLPSRDEPYLKKVRDALDEREMVLADLCVDGAHVWEDKAEDREKNHRAALEWLNAAAILGARFMRTDAGGRADTWTDEQFAHIVERYREYARFAQDHGFRVGAENHWGTERTWANLKKLYEAVGHPAFRISFHIGSWTGSDAERAAADRAVCPWAGHTHIAWDVCEGPLEEKLANLWNAGYDGYYSVEHHSAANEYRNVAIQLAKVRSVLERLRTGRKS